MAPICSVPPLVVLGFHPYSLKILPKYFGVNSQNVLPDGIEDLLFSIQKNSLKSLRGLSPMVKTVIFTDDPQWREVGHDFLLDVAWQGKEKTVYETNEFGLPFFRSLMGYLETNYFAPFYGYMDSNTLLSSDFVSALRKIGSSICQSEFETTKTAFFSKSLLVKVKADFTLDGFDIDKRIYEMKKPLQMSKSNPFNYVVMTRGLFDWEDVNSFPNYVISRQYLIESVLLMCQQTGVALFDGTRTVTTLLLNPDDFIFYKPIGATSLDLRWNSATKNPFQISVEIAVARGQRNRLAHFFTFMKNHQIFFEKSAQPSDLYPR